MSDVNDEQRKLFEEAYAKEYGMTEIPTDEVAPPLEEKPESPPAEEAPPETPPEAPPEETPETNVAHPESGTDDGAKDEEIDLEAEWEKLHPKAKHAIQVQREQEQRNAQAAIGRVAFLNSELDKLKKTLAQQPQATQPAPVTAKPAELTTEQWNKLRKDDPELASAIQEALEERDRRVVESVKGEWGTAISPLDAKTKELETKLEVLTLDAQVPYWREATQSPEWKEWIGFRLHPEEREALFKSEKASDVLPYVKAFNEEYTAYLRLQQQSQGVATPQASTELADKVAQDRAKKLQQPTAGPASPPRTKPEPILDPNDPVAMRKLFEQNLAREYANG